MSASNTTKGSDLNLLNSRVRPTTTKEAKRQRTTATNWSPPPGQDQEEEEGPEDDDPFPLKLHKLLEQLRKEGKQNILGWNPDGRSFSIFKPKEFIEEIMTEHFPRQSQYKSFQRQLNLYEFNRESLGSVKGIYSHRLFRRDNRELCKNMRREQQRGRENRRQTLLLSSSHEGKDDGGCRVDASKKKQKRPRTTGEGAALVSSTANNDFSEEQRTAASLFSVIDLPRQGATSTRTPRRSSLLQQNETMLNVAPPSCSSTGRAAAPSFLTFRSGEREDTLTTAAATTTSMAPAAHASRSSQNAASGGYYQEQARIGILLEQQPPIPLTGRGHDPPPSLPTTIESTAAPGGLHLPRPGMVVVDHYYHQQPHQPRQHQRQHEEDGHRPHSYQHHQYDDADEGASIGTIEDLDNLLLMHDSGSGGGGAAAGRGGNPHHSFY